MESFYTYTNFFHLVGVIIGLLFLLPLTVTSNGRLRTASALLIISLILGILSPISPFPHAHSFRKAFLFVLVGIFPFWLYLFIQNLRRPSLSAYQKQIFDSLKDSVYIFDTSLRILGQGGNRSHWSAIDEELLLTELKALIKGNSSPKRNREVELRIKERIFQCHYQKLRRAYVMTVKDLTEQRILIDRLKKTNQDLEKRRTMLKETEAIETTKRREQMRRELSNQISLMIREKLDRIEQMTQRPDPVEAILKEAEETLQEIRAVVDQLAPLRRQM